MERIETQLRGRDRSAGRARRRAPGAGRRRRRLRRGRGRQDDADPRRLPRARHRGAGHLADLHDRPALRRRPPAGLPPRPLPAGEPRGRGPGPARRLPRPRRRRLRRVAGGRGGAARPAGAGDPARARRRGQPPRSRSTGSAAATRRRCVFRRQRTQLVASRSEFDPRREGPNEGTESACGGDWS